MSTQQLDQLASRMGRPSRSLQAFGRLTPEQLVMLREAVDEACVRQHRNLGTALSEALPRPLRWLVLRLLRGRET